MWMNSKFVNPGSLQWKQVLEFPEKKTSSSKSGEFPMFNQCDITRDTHTGHALWSRDDVKITTRPTYSTCQLSSFPSWRGFLVCSYLHVSHCFHLTPCWSIQPSLLTTKVDVQIGPIILVVWVQFTLITWWACMWRETDPCSRLATQL